MHNGFVRVDDEKMSKSLGNFFTVREVLEWVRDPEVVRYFIVNSQYRGPINYTPDSLTQADAALEGLYTSLRGVPLDTVAGFTSPASAGEVGRRPGEGGFATDRFVAAMDDDFNTPIAVSELQALAREVNKAKAAGDLDKAAGLAAEMRLLGARLGLLGLEPEVFLRKRAAKQVGATGEAERTGGADASAANALSDADIERLIDERAAARKVKDFKESDRIRDLLASNGVQLEDQPGGRTLWRRG
jgi:cysteinyl-tRNA synthetase